MRIRFRRSQRMSGIMSKSAVFSLEARVDITDEEVDHIKKYKMGQEVVYKKERVSGSNGNDDTWTGLARNFASYATALTIRIDDLIKGTKIECKDIMEMMSNQYLTPRLGVIALLYFYSPTSLIMGNTPN